jgi:hypothetical protein
VAEHGKRNNAERLFKGEASGFGIEVGFSFLEVL